MIYTSCLEILFTSSIETPIGLMTISACEQGLHSVHQVSAVDHDQEEFETKSHLGQVKLLSECDNLHIQQCESWLSNYFDVRSRPETDLTVPNLCTKSFSDFKVSVWKHLMNTKPGETLSYSELSFRTLGHCRASRAVGTAMKTNPFQILVPCHRVIKSTGLVGNYAYGTHVSQCHFSGLTDCQRREILLDRILQNVRPGQLVDPLLNIPHAIRRLHYNAPLALRMMPSLHRDKFYLPA
ncbi:Methylated-DNA--protein-cysteine methyltransferase [Halotydeus destructor]|nr:Methylated-DNA--protein-cysteine methyltransferase [Halotydeus destructor]